MEANLKKEDVLTLFYLIGEAVWKIQALEEALNHSIALKNPEATTKEQGDALLNSNRELTLGKAIKLAKKESIYDADLQIQLQDFLNERNWLIHRCLRESSYNETVVVKDKNNLFNKIKNIASLALFLQEAIEEDMLKFVSSKGRDDIRKKVEQARANWGSKFE